MATSTLPKKLQLKTGQRAVIINAPSGYLNTLTSLPEGVGVIETLEPAGQYDFVLLFIKGPPDTPTIHLGVRRPDVVP